MGAVSFNSEKFYRIAYDYFFYESNVKEAKKFVNKALLDDKNHFKSLLLKGQIFLCENKIKLSEKYLLRAYEINSKDVTCIAYLACIYNLKGDLNLALKFINEVFEKEVEDKEFLAECYKLKINLLINLNQLEKAEDTLRTLDEGLYSDEVTYFKAVVRKSLKINGLDGQNRILYINF